MKKKLIYGSIALLMAFSLTACNQTPGETTPSDSAGEVVEGSITIEGFTPEIDLAKKTIKFELANSITKFDLTKLKMAGFTTTITDKDGKEVKGEVELNVGTNAFTASFKAGDVEFSFEVVVKRLDKDAPTPDAKLTGIEVAPTFPTEFYVGEEFVRGDIYLCYNDGTKKLKSVTKDNLTDFSTTEAGERTLKLESDGHTISVKYKVVAKDVAEALYLKDILVTAEAYRNALYNKPAQFEKNFEDARKEAVNKIPAEVIDSAKEVAHMLNLRAGQLTKANDLLLNQVYDVFKNMAKAAVDSSTPLTYLEQIDDAQLNTIKDGLRIAINLFDDEQYAIILPQLFVNLAEGNNIYQEMEMHNPITGKPDYVGSYYWSDFKELTDGMLQIALPSESESIKLSSTAKSLVNAILDSANSDILAVRDGALVLISLLGGAEANPNDPGAKPMVNLLAMSKDELELSNKLIPAVKALARILRNVTANKVLASDLVDAYEIVVHRLYDIYNTDPYEIMSKINITSLIRKALPYVDRILAEIDNFSIEEVKAVYNIVEIIENPKFNPETDLSKCLKEALVVTDHLLPILKDIKADSKLLEQIELIANDNKLGAIDMNAFVDLIIKTLETPKEQITDELLMKLNEDIEKLINFDWIYLDYLHIVGNVNDFDGLLNRIVGSGFEYNGEHKAITKEMISNIDELENDIKKPGAYQIKLAYKGITYCIPYVVVDPLERVGLVFEEDSLLAARRYVFVDKNTGEILLEGANDSLRFNIHYYHKASGYVEDNYIEGDVKLIRNDYEKQNDINYGLFELTTATGEVYYYYARYILVDQENPVIDFKINGQGEIDGHYNVVQGNNLNLSMIINYGLETNIYHPNWSTEKLGLNTYTFTIDGKEYTFNVNVITREEGNMPVKILHDANYVSNQILPGEMLNPNYLFINYENLLGQTMQISLADFIKLISTPENPVEVKARIQSMDGGIWYCSLDFSSPKGEDNIKLEVYVKM